MKLSRIHNWAGALMLLTFLLTAKADDKTTYQDNILPLIQANCCLLYTSDAADE